jgi:predicted NUDIX family NTP pyrophosphohydrolase
MAGEQDAKTQHGSHLYRWTNGELEVFLLHPGGSLWGKKGRGAWSLPKGEYKADEDALIVTQREFHEETGLLASGTF